MLITTLSIAAQPGQGLRPADRHQDGQKAWIAAPPSGARHDGGNRHREARQELGITVTQNNGLAMTEATVIAKRVPLFVIARAAGPWRSMLLVLKNFLVEVLPSRIHGPNQCELALAGAGLELFFAANGRIHRLMQFVVNQRMDLLTSGESVDQIAFVLPNPAAEIGRHAGVERAIGLAGEDVDRGLTGFGVSHAYGHPGRFAMLGGWLCQSSSDQAEEVLGGTEGSDYDAGCHEAIHPRGLRPIARVKKKHRPRSGKDGLLRRLRC